MDQTARQAFEQNANFVKETIDATDFIRTPRNFDTEQCNSSFLNFEHSESTEKLCQLETPTESCIERKKPLIPRSLNLDTTQPSEHFSGNSNSNLDLFEDDANNEDDKDSTLSEINENDIEAEESVLANHDRSLLSNGVLECSAIVGSSMTDLENEVIRKSLNESATVEASAEDSDSEISKCNRNNEDSKDIKTFLKKYIECMARSDITAQHQIRSLQDRIQIFESQEQALQAKVHSLSSKLDGIQNELDRERQHRLNSEIDNRQLKYETNQAYADQTTLNKRLEALEKRIEEHVSHGVGVPLGATVPPAPKNMYPPSGSGAPFDPPNYGIDLERFKKDIEAQCRMELIEQQQKVNNYLDEQIHMRSNFEKARAEQENALKQEYNRRISDLELEIRKYKDLYGVTIPVRDPGTMVGAGSGAMASLGEDPELKRLHTLLEKERRQREKLESRLDRMVDRDIENRAQIAVEKQRMNDLTSSSGLGTLGLGSQSGHVSEFDALLEKVRRQLDNSISRHLGTTKMELEMFSQHPYATRDRSFNIPNSSRLSNFNSSYKF